MDRELSLAEASEPFMDGYNKAIEDVEKLICSINYEKNSDWNNFTIKFLELKEQFVISCQGVKDE